jgi:hypothetical protein
MDQLPETNQYVIFKRGEDRKVQVDFDELVKYLKKQIKWIEELNDEITKRVNWLIGLMSGDGLELIKPGNVKGGDGNAKLVVDSSGDLKIQFRVSGTWTDTGFKLKGS